MSAVFSVLANFNALTINQGASENIQKEQTLFPNLWAWVQ